MGGLFMETSLPRTFESNVTRTSQYTRRAYLVFLSIMMSEMSLEYFPLANKTLEQPIAKYKQKHMKYSLVYFETSKFIFAI